MRSPRPSQLLLVLVALGSTWDARAETVTYLIAVGTNQAPASWADAGLSPLRYADDDAMAFAQFALELGWRTTVLTVPDEETQRRYPALVERAKAPTLTVLREVLAEHQEQIQKDRAVGRESDLVLFYSGHGRHGAPALALLEGEITQELLHEEILATLPARYLHLFIDACHAESIVRARSVPEERDAEVVSVGPEDVRQWSEQSSLARFPQVGAIIATAAEAKAHEWDVIGRGVFTHEVLSGLRGAADVNGDGRIEYSELHAFISAANREVDAPEAKLDVVVRVPEINLRASVVDLRAREPELAWIIGGDASLGRFFVEDARGTRLADAHAEPGHRVSIAVPAGLGLRVVSESGEASLELRPGDRLDLGTLDLLPPSERARGAVASALSRGLFSAPYGPLYYRGFADRRGAISVALTPDGARDPEERATWPVYLAWGAAGALVVTSAVLGGLALDARADWNATDLQGPALEAHERYDRFRVGFFLGASGAAVAAAVGVFLFPWSE